MTKLIAVSGGRLEKLNSLLEMSPEELWKEASSKEHQITESFDSFQGEGANAGHPSYFIRYSKCNFRCVWCDSSRTWLNKRTESVDSLLGKLNKSKARNVVITGGEPMLYRYNPEFVAWLRYLALVKEYRIEVESDAALTPSHHILSVVSQWNLSPKLGSSGVEMTDKYAAAIREWVILNKYGKANAWFKFVVANEADFEEVNAFVERFEVPIDRVYLMPEGTTVEVQLERMAGVAEMAMQKGYSFSPRTHILAKFE